LSFSAGALIFRKSSMDAHLLPALAVPSTGDPSVLSGLISVLSALSSVAVILGVVFIVIQLRQNNKLIDLNAQLTEATFRDVKSNISFEMLEKLTDDSFARRRSFMWHKVKEYQASNWEDFDDSSDDFEIRNFAYMYDLYGQLAKEGLLDFETMAKTFKYMVVLDWEAFEPVVKHIMKRYNLEENVIFPNFQWLAYATEQYFRNHGSPFPQIMHPEDKL